MDHSLGFDFKLSWTHPKDELINKQMLSSSILSKNKEVLARNGGGKERKQIHLLHFDL